MRLITETFTCSKADKRLEYGFTFKKSAHEDDCVFDLVLGEITVGEPQETRKFLRAQWRKYRPMANAIAAAGVVPPKSGSFFEAV